MFYRPDQCLNALRVDPRGIRRVVGIELLQRAIRINPVVEIARRLPNQSAQVERDLLMRKGRVKPLLIGGDRGAHGAKEKRFSVAARVTFDQRGIGGTAENIRLDQDESGELRLVGNDLQPGNRRAAERYRSAGAGCGGGRAAEPYRSRRRDGPGG